METNLCSTGLNCLATIGEMVAALAATSSPNRELAVSNMIDRAAKDCYLSLRLRLRPEGFQASDLGFTLLHMPGDCVTAVRL